MLIIGAKGFAKELLQVFEERKEAELLAFFDDVNIENFSIELKGFEILNSLEEAKIYLQTICKNFTIGIGKPQLRYIFYEKFREMGGEFCSLISPSAYIGSRNVDIKNGCNILSGVKISNGVQIGMGTMIYYNAIITHDVEIGMFVEISPAATILGRARIGDFTWIGAGAIIFPDVQIGQNCIIAAGAVVRENVPDNMMVAGLPAKQKKKLN